MLNELIAHEMDAINRKETEIAMMKNEKMKKKNRRTHKLQFYLLFQNLST